MYKTLLFSAAAFLTVSFAYSQNVFNPSDPIVRYDQTKALGSAQRPDPAKAGLQKWVSTPTTGISSGSDAWDASSFKAYYLNQNGIRMAFRIKYPYSYSLPSGVGKKYPVMLFLHGAGEVGCSTNGGIYNNEKQIWLGGQLFRDRVNNNQFDGFLVYPQLVSTDGCWGAWGTTSWGNLNVLIQMIDSMSKYIRADIDRVMVDGLSGGGYGAFRMADNFPQRITKIAPSAAAGSTNNRNAFVHIPIWFATGGKDPDPSPTSANYTYTRMKEIGADIRYTQYPDLGHAVWYNHWRENDFVPFMNDMHKANPLVFFQQNEFCPGGTVNAKLGLTPGFNAYEWQRDGVTIATRTGSTNNVSNWSHVVSFTGNEITVKSFGTYRVRFRRTASSAWSEWSHKPAVITTKGTTQPPPVAINGIKSNVLPALDGSTTVPLMMPAGFINYEWIRVSDNVKVSSSQIYNAPVGVYKAKYDEQNGCGSAYSAEYTVVSASGSPKPSPATNLASSVLSSGASRLTWSQGSGETGFEIYRGTNAGGPYDLLALTDANVTTYQDDNTTPNTSYFYLVRAVNGTGAATESNESSPTGGNLPPSIGTINNMYAKTDGNTQQEFSVTDAAGDVVTVTFSKKPNFISLTKTGTTTYRITAAPTVDNLGWSDVTVRATDNKGFYSEKSFSILVADKNTRSVYVNLGSNGKSAPAPWNNWLGTRGANNTINNLTDENNSATPFWLRTVSAWATTTDLGHITGNNSGVVPDAVLQSGIADNGTSRQLLFGGLNPSMRYNLVFVGSQNEGLTANMQFSSGSQSTTLEARYNTNQTANLNGLVPNSSGQITVNISRVGSTAYSYVNAVIIEEYSSSITLLNPINLYAEPIDRSVVQLTWSDRTNSESSSNGYQLQRATDSLFTQNVATYNLAANTRSYRNTGAWNSKFWYRVRARNGNSYSAYSNRVATITPTAVLYVNFNATLPPAPSPWNNLTASPMNTFTSTPLKNQSGGTSSYILRLDKVFNGEFTAGVTTGNNSGIVPDNALAANYWLDNTQLCEFRLSGLVKTRRYRIGFFGSSSSNGWFKGNYTAKYSINDRSVYLNSWMNSTKIVYIGDVVPDANGQVPLQFTTTPEGAWAFNAGLVIMEYADNQGGTVQNSVLDENSDWIGVSSSDSASDVNMYPNPSTNLFNIDFTNSSTANKITTEVYDLHGKLIYRRNYNSMPAGPNTLRILPAEANMQTGMYIVALKINGQIVSTVKMVHGRWK